MNTLFNYLRFNTVILIPFFLVLFSKLDTLTQVFITISALFVALQVIKYKRTKNNINVF